MSQSRKVRVKGVCSKHKQTQPVSTKAAAFGYGTATLRLAAWLHPLAPNMHPGEASGTRL